MKNLSILIVLLCTLNFSANATNVSGIISTNTTWTKANSPYIVNGNLSVDSAVTLTIEPGVTVRVDSGYFFNIDGILKAVGTTTDSIKFTANRTNPSKNSWAGITFSAKAKTDTSSIKYCLFEYGLTSILNEGASLEVFNSVFRYNTTAIRMNLGHTPASGYRYTYIGQCLMTKNEKGLYNTSGKNFSGGGVTGNTFTYNGTGYRDESAGGLGNSHNNFNYNIVGASFSGGQGRSIDESTFIGNITYGIYIAASTPQDAGNIRDNDFTYNGTAIFIDNIEKCIIYENTIAYNGLGVVVNHSYTGALYVYWLQIWNNCFTNNAFYNLKHNSHKDITAKENWWGTASAAGIDSMIYDFNDNPSSGKVTDTLNRTTSSCPPLSAPPPCLHVDSVVVNVTSHTTATVTWPAVTSAPGYEYYVIPISSTPPSQGSYTFDTTVNLNNLVAGHSYKICVRALCLASPFTSAWVCDTMTMTVPPCDSPTNLFITEITETDATFSWDSVAGATGYEYYVTLHPAMPPSAATVTGSTTAFLTGLNANEKYFVCVRTKCGNRFSAWSCDTLRTPAGINTIGAAKDIRVYPNPSHGTFSVSLGNSFSENAMITVYDLTGRVVTSKEMKTDNETISINHAAKGVYMLQVRTDNAVLNKRIVIE